MSEVFRKLIADRTLTIETGKLAQQANGSTVVTYGDTVVLVTACNKSEPAEKKDFLPLTVDYEERLYAIGKIPGSFFRREGRPGEEAIITCRLIDRCLRPLLYKEFGHEIQIVATVLSADRENDPDICALIGASAALTLSDIPFSGPVSAVHVGYIDDSLVLNPPLSQMGSSLLDVIVASTKQTIAMVEVSAKEASENLILEAIQFGHEANQEIIKLQEELQQVFGKPKTEIKPKEIIPGLLTQVSTLLDNRLLQALTQPKKAQREQALAALEEEVIQKSIDSFSESEIASAFQAHLRAELRKFILEKRQHIDGRQSNEIRPITCEVQLLPCTHGSGKSRRNLV